MKVYFTFGFWVLFISPCLSQWNLSGNSIIGDNSSNAIGYSISINGEGNRVSLVKEGPSGGNQYDYTYVYELQDYQWVQLGNEIQAANMNTTSFVAMNELGNRIIIGEDRYNNENLVRIYELQSNSWVQLGETIFSDANNDYFGKSLAINAEGDVIICGAPGYNYSKVYQFINNEWEQKGETLIGNGSFGESVSLNAEGNIIAISSPYNSESAYNGGKVNIYEYQNGDWWDLGLPIYGTDEGDLLGIGNKPGTNGIDLNSAGDVVVIGGWGHIIAPDDQAGQVKIYERSNNNWSQKGETIEGTNENYYFGGSVAINSIGDMIVVGDFLGMGFGQVKVFKYELDSWEQYGNTVTGAENGLQSFFGFSVAINNEGNIIGIGSPDDSSSEPSQVRIFEYNGILGTEESLTDDNPRLYPNPNSGTFYLNVPASYETSLIRIVDMTGKIIYSNIPLASETIEINENLSSGIYFVNVFTKTSTYNLKMIIE